MAPDPEGRQPNYTLYGSRRRAAAPPREEPERRSLTDLIIRAGAVAAAIGSIAAVVALIWPDPPVRQGAKFSNVSQERNVTLADFAARQEFATLNSIYARGRPADKVRGTGPRGRAVVVLASTDAPDGGGTTTMPEGEGDTATEGDPAEGQDPGSTEENLSKREAEDQKNKPMGSGAKVPGNAPRGSTADARQLGQRMDDEFDCGEDCLARIVQ